MMDIEALALQIKLNCDISDAKYWGYYSICGLLMRYRELYRSEHSMLPWDKIDREEISAWIDEREALWRTLEGSGFQALTINGVSYGSFDINGINNALSDSGLVYGCGYGMFHKPDFFLAKLASSEDRFDYRVYYAGNELCRDLSASPAMRLGRCVFLRTEIVQAILWDKFQELGTKRYGGLLKEIFLPYGITETVSDPEVLSSKFESAVRDASELFVLHEIGEAFEDDYSDEWLEILSSVNDKYAELFIRGVKDLLADTSEMGPLKKISESENIPLLNFYMAFLHGFRKELFPEIRNVFQQFVVSNDWLVIEQARKTGYQRAEDSRDNILKIWWEDKDPVHFAEAIKKAFPVVPVKAGLS